MNHYYINQNPQPDGYHEVHNGDVNCSHPPLVENRISLGYFNSCSEAIASAKRANPTLNIDGCYWCVRPCHTR